MNDENAEIIDSLTVESEILQNSFPKGCLMTAEDIAMATSPNEVDFFGNLDTANRILTVLIEHETKLQRAFEKNAEFENKSNMTRNQSLTGISDFASMTNMPFQTASLPAVDSTVTFSQSVHVDTHFSSLFEFNLNKLILAGFRLLPPLANSSEFNGAIYKLAFFAHSVQNVFEISSDIQIFPYPSSTIIQIQNEKRKLYFLPKKSQIQDIQALQITVDAFLRNCIVIANSSSAKLNLKHFVPFKYDDLNITAMLNMSSVQSEWTQAACGIIKLAQHLVKIIDKVSKLNTSDGSYSELIINEDETFFKLE
ncbi:hypothetical protein TRFO_06436 [Tritrichomonas foetus]|uniref:Atg6 BARA domain-containing protein n=1 Tax=Tritrichomonas foetus TaxID=1144522 RepID=A0A1J4K074_9EUKA|nr:hypothetical protein TRFO_06436 [Tritrichomonas foetus]|eukprot:OHT04128.1 hypothetical protein TRFO_06436 [Tritrichomonas foetus]